MSTVTQLDSTKITAASRLVAGAIPHVGLSHIGRPDDGPHAACRQFLAAGKLGLPEDLWLGVDDKDGQMIAALHAAPLVGNASRFIQTLLQGSAIAGSPSWIARLLREVLMVEEIAVVPAERYLGHGAALLRECHRIARGRGVKHVQAHAGSATAQDLFRSAGYLVAPPRNPVPKQYQCNLLTKWDPTYDHFDGSYVYNHIDQLS